MSYLVTNNTSSACLIYRVDSRSFLIEDKTRFSEDEYMLLSTNVSFQQALASKLLSVTEETKPDKAIPESDVFTDTGKKQDKPGMASKRTNKRGSKFESSSVDKSGLFDA